MTDDLRRQYGTVLMGWLVITLTINIVIVIFVPFPYSMPLMIGVVVIVQIYLRRRVLKRMGLQPRSLFHWGADSERLITYYCLHCGFQHNEAVCPHCKSKAKRAGF
jgi:hypothetical protein